MLPGSENKIILRLRIIAYYLFQILTSALVPKKIGILLDHRTFIAWLKYEQASSFFRKKPIRVLLIGNDHVSLFRAVILAAKENAIKTIYIPHASVGPHFPPLDFDFALLEGEEMKRIYLNIGKTTTNIHLIGQPKTEHIIAQPPSFDFEWKYGLAFGIYTTINEIQSYIEVLNQDEILIRLHPADRRRSSLKRQFPRKFFLS